MNVIAAPGSPYKGLAVFEDSDLDALLFFGRGRETEVIAANLQAARLTVLYGPSGVGKSSILRAGVARRLRQEPEAAVKLVDTWTGDAVAAVRDAVDATPEGADVHLILDQFEEYFVYHGDDLALPRLLAELVADRRLRVNILIGIREDALAQLDAFRRPLPTLLANRLQLHRLDRSAARDAILKPIERYNELTGKAVEIEPGLVEDILDQVAAGRVDLGRAGRAADDGEQPDRIEAPYLQLVLQTIWETERASGSNILRADTLRQLGGAARIVHEHLEHAMAEFTSDEKQAAAEMYNHLVTPSGTKIALGIGDLAGYAELSESQAAEVLEKLARERIVRASSENGPASARYEIFHDVLAEAVLAWRARHEEQQALKTSEQRRRRAFSVAIAALVGLLVVGAIAVFALIERGNSRSQARRAHAEELAANALTQMGVDPSSSLRLAEEAARLRPGVREQDVLRRALVADRLRGILRAGGPIAIAAYDASGRHELVAATDGKARLYERQSLRPVHVLDHGASITAGALSPNGAFTATGGADGGVRLWDNASGARIQAVSLRGAVHSVEFDASGHRLMAAAGNAIAVWRTRNAKRLAFVPLPRGKSVLDVVMSPSGRRAVAVLRDKTTLLYSLPDGRLVGRLTHDGFVEDAAFSPDGELVATAGYAGDVGGVHLWSARSGRPVRDLVGALRHVRGVAFSDDGKLVAAASADGTARVWETATGTQTAIMIGHTNEVTSVDFNPAGTALVSASPDGTARVWGASGGAAGRLLAVLAGHRGPVLGAAFSPDGRSVLTAGQDGTARIWDPGSEPELALLARGPAPLTGLGVTTDGRTILVGREDGGYEERALDGRLERRLFADGPVNGFTDAIRGPGGGGVEFVIPPQRAVLYAPKARLRAFATDTSVRVEDMSTGRSQMLHPQGGPVEDADLDSNGRVLAIGMHDGTVQLWNPRSGRLVRTLPGHHDSVNSVEFSPNGNLLVSASRDRDARIWDPGTGRLVQLLHGHFGPVLDARFSPDGRWVVTAGPITAGLWLVGSTEGPIFLDAPVTRPLSGAAFAGKSGRLVVATSLDGTLRAYNCDICGDVDELLELARQRLAAKG
jgi:WD40 repeat protein